MIYVHEDKPGSEPMWNREAQHQPICPCCISGTGFPRPPSTPAAVGGRHPSFETEPSYFDTTDSDESSAGVSGPGFHRHARSLGSQGLRSISKKASLKFKKSMGNLRRKASVSSV